MGIWAGACKSLRGGRVLEWEGTSRQGPGMGQEPGRICNNLGGAGALEGICAWEGSRAWDASIGEGTWAC